MKLRFVAVSMLLCLIVVAFAGISSAAEISLADIMGGSTPDSVIYKKIGDFELKLYVSYPPGFHAGEKRTGVLWIHGGGWRGGRPDMFFPMSRYYASREAVGFCVQYRLAKENGPTVSDCIKDCKSALRFIRAHADSFGVGPGRIAVMGDSAGGHLAACLGVTDGHNEPSDDMSISAVADAMVLYNPVVDLTVDRWLKLFQPVGGQTAEELAYDASPLFDIDRDEPPCMVLHGFNDPVVPYSQAVDFARLMVQKKNTCDLMLLGDTTHAFVIPGYTATEETIVRAIRAGDEFLVTIGMLEGQPSLVINPK